MDCSIADTTPRKLKLQTAERGKRRGRCSMLQHIAVVGCSGTRKRKCGSYESDVAESQPQKPTQAESKLPQSRETQAPSDLTLSMDVAIKANKLWWHVKRKQGAFQGTGTTRERLNKQFSLISDNAHAKTRCWLQKKWSTWHGWHATLAKAQHKASLGPLTLPSLCANPRTQLPSHLLSELLACSSPKKNTHSTRKKSQRIQISACAWAHEQEKQCGPVGKTCYQMLRRTANCQPDHDHDPGEDQEDDPVPLQTRKLRLAIWIINIRQLRGKGSVTASRRGHCVKCTVKQSFGQDFLLFFQSLGGSPPVFYRNKLTNYPRVVGNFETKPIQIPFCYIYCF